MDIDHLIETRSDILLSEILEANKNVKNIKKTNSTISYYYRGEYGYDLDAEMEVSSILNEIENKNTSDFLYYRFLVFILDSSHSCMRKLKQKSYDRISSHLYPRWLAFFNIIITEKDTGIMTKYFVTV